jgi:diphthamide synthase subunit DPH2
MKKIVLCGSKKFIPKFFELEKELKNMGFNVVVPREFIVDMEKKDASLLHFSEIDKDDVDALLIVNESKNGQDNYIGANGFAELAFGFYKGKEIYLLNDIYEPYSEELVAWEVTPLKGDISKLEEIK